MPSVAAGLGGQVDLSTGAAWAAMPSVATRLIGVVDVCCLHTLHVSLRPAAVPSASICLPLRNARLLQLVDVVLSSLSTSHCNPPLVRRPPCRDLCEREPVSCLPQQNVRVLQVVGVLFSAIKLSKKGGAKGREGGRE